jgi:hypothetical protein
MKGRKIVLTAAATLVAGSAIAWSAWADVRDARLGALLVEIESAEGRIPHVGVREMGAEQRVVLRVWSDGDRKRVDFAGVKGTKSDAPRPAPPRLPVFKSFPAFLRPGHGQWKKVVKDPELTVRNYEVLSAGTGTVASRAADLYEIRPRHAGRASYRVAADRENRFPLRFEVLARDQIVFATEFTEISYERPSREIAFREPPAWPQWVKVDREDVPVSRMTERAGFGVWAPRWTPRGFELQETQVLDVRAAVPEATRRLFPGLIPDGPSRVAVFNYPDGLAVLSVVEVSAESALWKLVQRWLPAKPQAEGEKVVAQRFQDRFGAAYVMEIEGTVVLVAGNVSPGVIEPMIRTFERR